MRITLLIALTLVVTGCSKQTAEDPVPTEPTPDPMSRMEEVKFEAAGMTIHGTITRPEGEGQFPAVAIAAGSGPTDRDWLNPMLPGDNGSAKLLAAALQREGVVVLRYDKRGTGASGMPPGAIVWGDYVDELGGAVEVLASKSYVDPARIHVAGHSEGGVHALRLAENPPVPLAGVILLSVAGRTLRDIVVWQISNQINVSGLNPAAAAAEIAALESAIDRIAAGETIDASKVGQLQGVQQFLMALQNPQSIAFARGLLTYDPLAAFARFELPMLIVSGARDIQVDPQLDARPLAEAAKAAGRPTQLVIAETADHVLKIEEQPREQLTPAVGIAYNAAGRELHPEVVSAITSFVAKPLAQ